ncbi:MAG TPA: hypothetical protein VJH96_01390 [Patescibacteria group bacterium]|nr:hypothetical protein [Patescibacteria group bacterium]
MALERWRVEQLKQNNTVGADIAQTLLKHYGDVSLLKIPEEEPPFLKVKELFVNRVGVEQNAWKNVLGVDVEVPPVPSLVTPEVNSNLKHLGFGLRYIPKLDLGTVDDLKKKDKERYLDELQKRSPGWRRYESLSDTERGDHLVGRNLEEWYWRQIKNGDIDHPQLPGVWVAVESMPKPSYGESYRKTPVSDKMGLSDRFNVNWNDAQAAIQKAKRGILSEAGLPSSLDVRMLETLEWNLLANREGWGATNTYEWTNTEYRAGGESNRVIAGYSGSGGAAYVYWYHPGDSSDDLGFRLVVVLGSFGFISITPSG